MTPTWTGAGTHAFSQYDDPENRDGKKAGDGVARERDGALQGERDEGAQCQDDGEDIGDDSCHVFPLFWRSIGKPRTRRAVGLARLFPCMARVHHTRRASALIARLSRAGDDSVQFIRQHPGTAVHGLTGQDGVGTELRPPVKLIG